MQQAAQVAASLYEFNLQIGGSQDVLEPLRQRILTTAGL